MNVLPTIDLKKYLVPILNVYENIVLPAALDGDTADKKFMDEIVRIENGRIVG